MSEANERAEYSGIEPRREQEIELKDSDFVIDLRRRPDVEDVRAAARVIGLQVSRKLRELGSQLPDERVAAVATEAAMKVFGVAPGISLACTLKCWKGRDKCYKDCKKKFPTGSARERCLDDCDVTMDTCIDDC